MKELISVIWPILASGLVFSLVVGATVYNEIRLIKRKAQIKTFNSQLSEINKASHNKKKAMFDSFNKRWGIDEPEYLFLVLSTAHIDAPIWNKKDTENAIIATAVSVVVFTMSCIWAPAMAICLMVAFFINLLRQAAIDPGVSDTLITSFDYDTYIKLKNIKK